MSKDSSVQNMTTKPASGVFETILTCQAHKLDHSVFVCFSTSPTTIFVLFPPPGALLNNVHFFFIWHLRFYGSDSHTTWIIGLGMFLLLMILLRISDVSFYVEYLEISLLIILSLFFCSLIIIFSISIFCPFYLFFNFTFFRFLYFLIYLIILLIISVIFSFSLIFLESFQHPHVLLYVLS